MAETQAEKNKRIEAQLKARGAKFTPSAEVKRQSQVREQKRERIAKTAPKETTKTAANGRTMRDPREYASGKKFDEVQRRAMRKAGVD